MKLGYVLMTLYEIKGGQFPNVLSWFFLSDLKNCGVATFYGHNVFSKTPGTFYMDLAAAGSCPHDLAGSCPYDPAGYL